MDESRFEYDKDGRPYVRMTDGQLHPVVLLPVQAHQQMVQALEALEHRVGANERALAVLLSRLQRAAERD